MYIVLLDFEHNIVHFNFVEEKYTHYIILLIAFRLMSKIKTRIVKNDQIFTLNHKTVNLQTSRIINIIYFSRAKVFYLPAES